MCMKYCMRQYKSETFRQAYRSTEPWVRMDISRQKKSIKKFFNAVQKRKCGKQIALSTFQPELYKVFYNLPVMPILTLTHIQVYYTLQYVLLKDIATWGQEEPGMEHCDWQMTCVNLSSAFCCKQILNNVKWVNFKRLYVSKLKIKRTRFAKKSFTLSNKNASDL